MAERVKAATVMVHVEYDAPHDNLTSWGTGFVVGDGLIMTNAHIVNDDMPKRVYVHNEYLPPTEARVSAFRYDPDGKGLPGATYYDVAVLSYAPAPGVQLPVLPFSQYASPRQRVFAFGYPGPDRRRDHARFSGTVSAPQAPLVVSDGVVNMVLREEPNLIMHTAPCTNGNSGGPLVNARGEVVGMQTWSSPPDPRNGPESFAIGGSGLAGFMRWHGFHAPYRPL